MNNTKLIKGKFQSFTDPRNGTKKINALIKLQTLIDAANEDGEVAITIIPQKDENIDNKNTYKCMVIIMLYKTHTMTLLKAKLFAKRNKKLSLS